MRDRLKAAIAFAIQKHVQERGQMHGLLPYSHHLQAVYEEVQRYSPHLRAAGVSREDIEAVWDAAWLHDIMEDCGIKQKELEERFGARVAQLVQLVTDEPGYPNRKTRKLATYEKIRTDPLAVYLKLADRLANVRAGGSLVRMYAKEQATFRRMLMVEGEWQAMWDDLEFALLEQTPVSSEEVTA